jgi:dihydropteroate synthase
MLHPQSTLNFKGRILTLERPLVMGILNVTPDSFFEGSRVQGNGLLATAERMLEEGADILDIGGMSSRPGAELITEEEELGRILPAIEALHSHFPQAILSVDTIRASVARQAVEAGASMVNDISAGRLDEAMYETVAALRVPYVLMHMQGTPRNMQQNPHYEDVVIEILDFFIREMGKLRELGIHDIILDPGFGFGKTLAHNYELLKGMQVFQILEAPVLAGLSRKSMITRLLGVNPSEALNGTTALHMAALQNGAKILRVHDVKEAVEVVKIFQQLNP